MDRLGCYIEAEKIIKQKEIKEAIKLIPLIVNLCIKKGLDFSLCENVKVIYVRNLNTGFLLTGYYSLELINYQNEENHTFKIKEIYERLKKYKS